MPERRKRDRTDTPPAREVQLGRRNKKVPGSARLVVELPRGKSKGEAESAERRRCNDSVLENIGSTLEAQTAGRPRRGESGPRSGSLRAVAAASGGMVSKDQLHRAGHKLATDGEVRDQRKFNRSEAHLTFDQEQLILTDMHAEWVNKQYVDYEKVRNFAVLAQSDPGLCAIVGAELCSKEEAWRPSDGWIAGFLKRWHLTSKKTRTRNASLSRPTIPEEERWVDENTARRSMRAHTTHVYTHALIHTHASHTRTQSRAGACVLMRALTRSPPGAHVLALRTGGG